jgi:hypothetical protein
VQVLRQALEITRARDAYERLDVKRVPRGGGAQDGDPGRGLGHLGGNEGGVCEYVVCRYQMLVPSLVAS